MTGKAPYSELYPLESEAVMCASDPAVIMVRIERGRQADCATGSSRGKLVLEAVRARLLFTFNLSLPTVLVVSFRTSKHYKIHRGCSLPPSHSRSLVQIAGIKLKTQIPFSEQSLSLRPSLRLPTIY